MNKKPIISQVRAPTNFEGWYQLREADEEEEQIEEKLELVKKYDWHEG